MVGYTEVSVNLKRLPDRLKRKDLQFTVIIRLILIILLELYY